MSVYTSEVADSQSKEMPQDRADRLDRLTANIEHHEKVRSVIKGVVDHYDGLVQKVDGDEGGEVQRSPLVDEDDMDQIIDDPELLVKIGRSKFDPVRQCLYDPQDEKPAVEHVDPSIWLGGDITQVPEATTFNRWFNDNKTDSKKMEEELPYWGPKHRYFEWEIQKQIRHLTHSPEFAGLVKSEYELQKGKSDLEHLSKQSQEDARKELRRAKIVEQQRQERINSWKRWFLIGGTTAALAGAITGCGILKFYPASY